MFNIGCGRAPGIKFISETILNATFLKHTNLVVATHLFVVTHYMLHLFFLKGSLERPAHMLIVIDSSDDEAPSTGSGLII